MVNGTVSCNGYLHNELLLLTLNSKYKSDTRIQSILSVENIKNRMITSTNQGVLQKIYQANIPAEISSSQSSSSSSSSSFICLPLIHIGLQNPNGDRSCHIRGNMG
jgi:hypothetical protein